MIKETQEKGAATGLPLGFAMGLGYFVVTGRRPFEGWNVEEFKAAVAGTAGAAPRIQVGLASGIIAGILLGLALVRLTIIDATEFLYFNF